MAPADRFTPVPAARQDLLKLWLPPVLTVARNAGVYDAVSDADADYDLVKAPLISRELKVAALLAEALSNRQIATQLMLSERTTGSHVRSILAKTQNANRTRD